MTDAALPSAGTPAVESALSVPLPSLAGAVEEHVRDGDCVWIGNFGCQLFAVGRELIRQERRDLHVVIASGGILLDQLLAGGVVGEATFAHCWSPVGPLPTRAFRREWEQGGEIVWHELSVAAISAALTAGAQGVPFAPLALDERTGYLAGGWSGDAIARAQSPFGDATVVRALVPDVAFVHAIAADRHGNAALGAPAGEATLAAQAARRVVVVAEELEERGAAARGAAGAYGGASAVDRRAAGADRGATGADRGATGADRGATGADRGANAAARGAAGADGGSTAADRGATSADAFAPTLPGVLVDAVVVEPGAARPDGVAGRYPRDVEAYLAYGASAATPSAAATPAPAPAPAGAGA